MQEDEIETLRRAMWALELGVAAVTDSGVRDVLRERAKVRAAQCGYVQVFEELPRSSCD